MLRLFAPAKVNLTLRVTGRRADGYHLLDSLVVFSGVGDTLIFEEAADLSLALNGPFGPALNGEGDNIVLKAARALDPARGAKITLIKTLPVASGIGGGSADAAATLVGLNRLWGLGLVPQRLREIGLSLGADVPVCVDGQPVRMSGVGELLEPLPPLPPVWLTLVNPGVHVATPAVFRARQGGYSIAAPFPEKLATAQELAEALAAEDNDLTEAAVSLAPSIAEVLAMLKACPGCLLARMSGSGATCFGLFDNAQDATAAAQALRTPRPTWWTAAAPILGMGEKALAERAGSA